MSNENHQDREREIRQRIAGLIQSNAQAPPKKLTDEERQKFHTAATRLDQLLKSAAAADREALKTAAARLDQLLADIDKGKDVTVRFHRRRDPPKQTGSEGPF